MADRVLGTLAIHMASGWPGPEVEISPVDDPRDRARNVVRLRKDGPTPRCIAIFPGLPPGRYDVWQGTRRLARAVTVHRGATEFLLPAASSAPAEIK